MALHMRRRLADPIELLQKTKGTVRNPFPEFSAAPLPYRDPVQSDLILLLKISIAMMNTATA